MNVYNIYVNSRGAREIVKFGWSWPGFFFGPFWALSKRMWVLGISILTIMFFSGMVVGWIEVTQDKNAASRLSVFFNISWLVVAVVFLDFGNKWRQTKLESRGYEYKGTVSASDPNEAIAVWTEESLGN